MARAISTGKIKGHPVRREAEHWMSHVLLSGAISFLTLGIRIAKLPYMRSITIREAQHDLPRLLRDVETGQKVEIRRRKKPVAMLTPLAVSGRGGSWAAHRRRLGQLWGDKKILVLDETLSDLRSED